MKMFQVRTERIFNEPAPWHFFTLQLKAKEYYKKVMVMVMVMVMIMVMVIVIVMVQGLVVSRMQDWF